MLDVAKLVGLLNRVPRPPEDEAIPRGVCDTDCDAFEKRTGLSLPDDLRAWLACSNGPCAGPGGLYGIRPDRIYLDIEGHLAILPSMRQRGWIPIAGDGCGNHYVVATRHEYGLAYPVLYVETTVDTERPAYIVASDIEHFLVFLLERELGAHGWPFDEQVVTHADPSIAGSRGVRTPWDRSAEAHTSSGDVG